VSTGEKYLAAGYVVVLAVLLAYVAIISLKLARLAREVDELARIAEERQSAEGRAEAPLAEMEATRS
jgi:hypothetical protein